MTPLEMLRRARWVIWIVAMLLFVLGFYLGLTTKPRLGATLWGLAALLSLLPFWSHRNNVGH